MGRAFGVVFDECYADIRLQEYHLFVTFEPSAAPMAVPVGRVALYGPSVALPDEFCLGICTFGTGTGNEKRKDRLSGIVPPIPKCVINC